MQNYAKSKVDLTAIQKMYFEEERNFDMGGTKEFLTNYANVRNISDFFYKYNHEDVLKERKGSGFIEWTTNTVPTSQAIRKLFARPDFIPLEGEVSLSKRIVVEGPISGEHQFVR